MSAPASHAQYFYCCLCPPGTQCIDHESGRYHLHVVTRKNIDFVRSMQPTSHERVAVGSYFCCSHLADHDWTRLTRRRMRPENIRTDGAEGRKSAEKIAGYRAPAKRKADMLEFENPFVPEPAPLPPRRVVPRRRLCRSVSPSAPRQLPRI